MRSLSKGGAIRTEGPVGRESSITGENKWKIAARSSINNRTSTQTRSSAIPTQGRQSGVPKAGVTKTFVQVCVFYALKNQIKRPRTLNQIKLANHRNEERFK